MKPAMIFTLVSAAFLVAGCGDDTVIAPEQSQSVLDERVEHSLRSTETAVTALLTWTLDVSEMETWIDEEGITHLRNLIVNGEINGDYTGEAAAVQNSNMNMDTGNGDAHTSYTGSWVLPDGRSGEYRGHIDWTVTDWYVEGHFEDHGTSGDVAGVKIRGTLTGMWGDPFRVIEGIIHDPHGE